MSRMLALSRSFAGRLPRSRAWRLTVPGLIVLGIAVIGFVLVTLGRGGAADEIKPLTPGTSWQWQLTGTINETVLDSVANPKKMYDIDLFDASVATITRLKAKNIVVICYFSAGSSEDWRPDYNSFPAAVKGNSNGWSGERWLDIRNISVLGPIMAARMDMAVTKGCNGVEPDNVDGYTNSTGFPLSGSHQLAYNRHLATLAHARGLSIGLKNDVDQIYQLVNDFDWALNEQCYQYNECDAYQAFIAQNKAVFGVEYSGTFSQYCAKANASDYDWLRKNLDLDVQRTACREGNGSILPAPPPISQPKAGDVNADNLVNGIDLSKVLFNYGKTGMTRSDGDFDGNTNVNALDLSQVLTNYGK